MVLVVQQWLPTNGRSENPVVAPSMEVDVSAGVQYRPESRRSIAREGMDLPARVRTSRQREVNTSSSKPFIQATRKKYLAQIKGGPSHPNDFLKKIASQMNLTICVSVHS